MCKAHHSLRFYSIGIDSLLEDDSMFMAVSIYSLCGALHVFAQLSEVFLMSVLGFGVSLCIFVSPISPGARTMFHQHSHLKVFSMCVLSCTSANGPKLVT